MRFNDRVGIGSKRKLGDGRLVVDAKFARAGIYLYAGSEVDPDNSAGLRDRSVVKVYRPPEEVFNTDSMASFAYKAVTDDHPPEMVTAANWNDFAKGFTDGEVTRDGDCVRCPMMLADGALVAKVDEGKSELSAGYDAEIEFALGFTPHGEAYDAIMRNIRGNHIAVVDKGRAGAECSIADTLEGTETMTTATATKSFVYDGISILVTDQAEQVILKLQGAVADANTAAATAATAHAAAIAAKDSELGTKDAEIADLKGKVLTDEQLDARVAERAALLSDVAKVTDGIDTKGKSVADIRSAVVAKVLGADKIADKSADYISALFDGLVANAGNDNGGGNRTLADAIGTTIPNGTQSNGNQAYLDSVKLMRDAWQTPSPAAAAA